MTETNKPATWFWVVSIIALIWNGMGVMAYLGQVMGFGIASMNKAERMFMESRPGWATGAFAIAVWGGLAGSLLLLIRKKIAATILALSFAGIVVQLFHAFVIADSYQLFGPGAIAMPIMILGYGAYLIYFSRQSAAKGWLS